MVSCKQTGRSPFGVTCLKTCAWEWRGVLISCLCPGETTGSRLFIVQRQTESCWWLGSRTTALQLIQYRGSHACWEWMTERTLFIIMGYIYALFAAHGNIFNTKYDKVWQDRQKDRSFLFECIFLLLENIAMHWRYSLDFCHIMKDLIPLLSVSSTID